MVLLFNHGISLVLIV